MQNFSLGRFVLVHALIAGILSLGFPATARGSCAAASATVAGSVIVVAAIATPVPTPEEEELAEALAGLIDLLENGLPAKREIIADINGDDIADEVIRSPGTIAAADGFIEVRSGTTGSLIFTLLPRPNERLFGFRAFTPGDINGDGAPEIVVATAIADLEKGALVVFSGATGIRLGAAIESEAPQGFTVEIYGDISNDAAVAWPDIELMASAVNGSQSLSSSELVRYDLDGDGVVSSIDFAIMLERAQQEPGVGTGVSVAAGIAAIAAVGGWRCYLKLAVIALQILAIIAVAVGCAPLVGPAWYACVVALGCQIVALINQIGAVLAQCLGAQDPALEALELLAAIAGAFCAGGAGLLQQWPNLLRLLRQLTVSIG
ncbi:MAG: hypothetical protein KF724_13885 [Phycisphaeraceae bacterium]|nr:hypothetical protein [Phycisphaeraceae bacterium]